MGKPFTSSSTTGFARSSKPSRCSSSRPRRSIASGHLNVSPKGLDTLRISAPGRWRTSTYVGSGSETIAHLRQNGRIVLMWCAFSGPPNIVRVHGRGDVIEPQDPSTSMSSAVSSQRRRRVSVRSFASRSSVLGHLWLWRAAVRVRRASGRNCRSGPSTRGPTASSSTSVTRIARAWTGCPRFAG